MERNAKLPLNWQVIWTGLQNVRWAFNLTIRGGHKVGGRHKVPSRGPFQWRKHDEVPSRVPLKGLFVTSYTYKSPGSVSHAHSYVWLRCSDKTPTQTTRKHQNRKVIAKLYLVNPGCKTVLVAVGVRGGDRSFGLQGRSLCCTLLLCSSACLPSLSSLHLTCMRALYTLQKTS